MDVKRISDMITLAVPVLIVCSCIRLITYYYWWNIPILDYLSASELLLLFVQPVLIIAALAAVYLAFTLVLAGGALLFVQLRGKEKKQEPANQAESANAAKTTNPIYGWVIAIVWLGTMTGFFFKGIWFDFEIIPTVLFHVFLLLGAAAAVRGLLPSDERDDRMKPLVTATIVVLMSSSFFYGRYQAHDTELHPAHITIALKDDTVVDTDSNRVYVGKTTSYYFFHNTKDKETSIIPAAEVKATYIKPPADTVVLTR
jgi:hypothetical protein